ncbi:nitrogen regulation protein NR(II), partial [Thermodesulfobacteriota bacterium]
MPKKQPPSINIGLVGGSNLCQEVLEKMAFEDVQEKFHAPVLAVADPDSHSPGVILAKELGLLTFENYHDLYDLRYNIQLIIILDPEQAIFEDILKTRPPRIRILSYYVFELFWSALGLEARKLKERTDEITTILNGIQDFILVMDPDLDIIDVNESLLRDMGYSREEVIGRKCYEIFHKSDHQCNDEYISCPLNEVVRSKIPAQRMLTRVDQNGERRYFELSIHPVWEKNGLVSKFIEISRDMTDRMREEAEIKRTLEQMVEERTQQLNETHAKLLHQDKMASLGKLSASVVHEINNPIAGVLNLIMLMKRIFDDGLVNQKEINQFNQYLNLMETETRRISRIVSNLLAFSRQSKMEMKSLDINRLIEKTLFLNSNLLKIHRVRVEKNLDPKLPELVGSGDQLQQVFMNFISNAAEAIEIAGD